MCMLYGLSEIALSCIALSEIASDRPVWIVEYKYYKHSAYTEHAT